MLLLRTGAGSVHRQRLGSAARSEDRENTVWVSTIIVYFGSPCLWSARKTEVVVAYHF